MRIVLADNTSIELEKVSSPVETTIQWMFGHLQHVPLIFKPWDSSYYLDSVSYDQLVDQLSMYAQSLGIHIDKQRCLDRNDSYFNELHKIYEKNYNGDPDWLDYHENIHLCQRFHYENKIPTTTLDWREKAGPLIKNFDMDWVKYSTSKIKKGDVYVEWNELGKTPYMYWIENEPHDTDRINELVKPWTKLRPKLNVAMDDIDLLDRPRMNEFVNWWKPYQDHWCQQNNLTEWSAEHMGAIVVYKVTNFQQFDLSLQHKNYPVKLLV